MTITATNVIQTGLEEKERKEISEGLFQFLADTYTLYLKTQNFHWNVTGPLFHSLHTMFEKQYQELAEATDLIAERIRALGYFVPATFSDFTRLATVREDHGVLNADIMIRSLILGHESLVRSARAMVEKLEAAEDQPTLDLLTDRMRDQEKTLWMLRSLLK